MRKQLIRFLVCTLLIIAPVVYAFPNGIDTPQATSRDNWQLQWSHAYGGMGHSQLAQPIGDLDDDGVNEIIVGGYENSGHCRIISYDATQETYVEEYSWYVPGGSYHIPTGACIFDLNEDGTLELVVSWGYTSADGVYAYTWDGTTLTTLDWYHGVGVDFLYDVYACDYNDDGHTEVIVSNAPNMGSGPWHVYVLRWETNHFVAEAFWACPTGASCECPMVWGGDVDNDHKTEIIADISYRTYYTAGTWALNWNTDTQTWDAIPVWTNYGSSTVYGDGIADLDEDGTLEIGIGSYGGTPSGWLFEWNGTTYDLVWHGEYPTGEPVIESVALGDADNDGHQEFVFGTQQVHIIGWHNGTYAEEITLTDPQSMLAGMNIGDFDTDGFNELKACEILSGTGSEFIWKYLDTTPPFTVCYLSGNMSGDVYISDVTGVLSAVDNYSGVNYTTYSLDSGAWTTYTSPIVVSTDGQHILFYYSVDNAGNIEPEKHTTFTIQHQGTPVLNITIHGGIGVTATITNTGNTSLSNINWSIELQGGLLLIGKRPKTGVITSLEPGANTTIKAFVFGVGKTTITVTAGPEMKTTSARVILMFVVVS